MVHVAPIVPELPVANPPHSRFGIASCALAAMVAIVVIALLVVAPDESAGPARLIAEIGAWVTLVAAGTGVILGIVGTFQADCQRLLSFVGIGVNVAAVFGTGSLMAIGAIAS